MLVITKDDFTDYLKAPEKSPQKLAEAGLKVNTQKKFFGQM